MKLNSGTFRTAQNVDKLLLPLLDVTTEGHLQQEIRDIIDELDIMLHIVEEQTGVIETFIKHARITFREAGYDHGEASSFIDFDGSLRDSGNHRAYRNAPFEEKIAKLEAKIRRRRKELEALKLSAQSTAQNVHDLLDLKQQHASVVQAYQAIVQGQESIKQSQAIILFTVTTIIFVRFTTVLKT